MSRWTKEQWKYFSATVMDFYITVASRAVSWEGIIEHNTNRRSCSPINCLPGSQRRTRLDQWARSRRGRHLPWDIKGKTSLRVFLSECVVSLPMCQIPWRTLECAHSRREQGCLLRTVAGLRSTVVFLLLPSHQNGLWNAHEQIKNEQTSLSGSSLSSVKGKK